MPAKIYRIVSIDNSSDLISHDRGADKNIIGEDSRGFKFERLLHVYPPHRAAKLFCNYDEYNNMLREHYLRVICDLHNHDNCGILTFENVCTVGQESLIVDQERSCVYIGHILNWSREYFNWWIENSNVGFECWIDSSSFVADFGVSFPGCNRGILMNAPGREIFGHWLIDFLPRMALSKLIKHDVGSKYLFGPLNEWMRDFIERSGISRFEILDTCFENHGELIVPTSTKLGYGFFEPLNTLAWRSLALSLNHENVGSPFPAADRIFVSRRHWQGGRAISFHEELETLMTSLGFMVVHPQNLSLREQAWIFSRAKVVVGEDGSALHNVIFSAPGTRLGVLMHPDRTNLWHAGICHLLGHQIAYAQLPSRPDEVIEGLQTISNLVSGLLNLDQSNLAS